MLVKSHHINRDDEGRAANIFSHGRRDEGFVGIQKTRNSMYSMVVCMYVEYLLLIVSYSIEI